MKPITDAPIINCSVSILPIEVPKVKAAIVRKRAATIIMPMITSPITQSQAN